MDVHTEPPGANESKLEESIKSRRKRARVIRLSPPDLERIKQGEISDPVDALHEYDCRELKIVVPKSLQTSEIQDGKVQKLTTNKRADSLTSWEKEILDQVPPHFGKL